MQFPNTAGIYQIINLVNGKIYVGSAKNLARRQRQHWHELRYNKHQNRYLQNSWNKHKEENFNFEVLQTVKDPKSLISCEQFFMDRLCCTDRKYGYNISPSAQSNLGFKQSNSAKKKLSKAHTGKKLSDEHRKNITKALMGNKYLLGRKMPKDTKDKISNSLKKTLDNPTVRKEMSVRMSGKNNHFYGKKLSKEHKLKLSEAHIGMKYSEETKKKVSLANQGEKHNMAKLNELQVRIIKSLIPDLKNRTIRLIDIAEYFNVSFYTISLIKCGKIWTHI